MLGNPAKYRSGLDVRDARVENKLARELRAADKEAAFHFIQALVEDEHRNVRCAGVDLARRAISDRDHLLALLRIGLSRRDASEIKMWYRAFIPRLGFRRVIKTVGSFLPADTDLVERALYQLRALASLEGPGVLPEIEKLESALRAAKLH